MALTKAKLQEQFDNGEYDIGVGTGTLAIADGGTGATTAAGALTNLGAAPSDYWKTIYPVGAIYMSVVSNSPNTLFGGTWESLGGRFLIGADGTYTAGSTGGASTHALTTAELASHSHEQKLPTSDSGGTVYSSNGFSTGSGSFSSGISTGISGSGSAHNNMPPYLSVYMWKRTA